MMTIIIIRVRCGKHHLSTMHLCTMYHKCIIDNSIMDASIMDTCIIDTCIIDSCIIYSYIIDIEVEKEVLVNSQRAPRLLVIYNTLHFKALHNV